LEISEVLLEELIVFDVESRTKDRAIRELAAKLENTGYVTDIDAYLAAVMKREEISSTGLGMGVAIPHGKSGAVAKACVVFGRSRDGIDYQSDDGEPVYLLFLIAAPEAADEHLRILANISRKLIHERVRNELRQAETAREVYQALS
jgi:fructose-specific phosphotransferase system IIA component